MNRIIINSEDSFDELDALAYVEQVIVKGRISGDGTTFCYATKFKDDTVVFADLTRTGSDTFRVIQGDTTP